MPSQSLRMLVAAVSVGLWMAAGWIFRLTPNAYLVAGIPYMFLFQVVAARRPVTELWLRDPSPRTFPWWTVPLAFTFAAYPAWTLVESWAKDSWPVRFWLLGATAGALPLAWAIANLRARTLRCLAMCMLTAGLWGLFVFCGGAALVAHHHGLRPNFHPWRGLASNFFLYLPVCFVIEEVFFRGALDSYVQRPGDRQHWLSAIWVSVLWGWWHLPVSGITTWSGLAGLALFYPLFHLPFGIAFSVYWRRSGSLLVPAAVHAFVDSVRNVVM